MSYYFSFFMSHVFFIFMIVLLFFMFLNFSSDVGVIFQLHSHETVVAQHVMSFWLLGKDIIC